MRAGTRKYRRGRPDCLIPAQKNSVPLIFDGLEYHKYKARQARRRREIVLISEDRFLHYALCRHLPSNRHVVIFPNLDALVGGVNYRDFSLLIIDLKGLTQPLIDVLQIIRRLSCQFPTLRIALLVARLPSALHNLIAASTACTLVNRRLPVPWLGHELRAVIAKPPDLAGKITVNQWRILEEMCSGKSLAALAEEMNKPYHHASYQLTRMMKILGISTRAQWLRLLHQITLPASADS